MIIFNDFEKWCRRAIGKGIPDNVVALVFNIYEGEDNRWSVEVVGTSSFDEHYDDWACDEVTTFDTRDNPFSWQEEAPWENVLSEVRGLVKCYIESETSLDKLKEMRGIACGFVDGDLELIYKNSAE